MTEEQACKLLDEWINRLHLEEWDIDFQWKVRGEDMNIQDSLGCATFVDSSRLAVIQMLDEVDYTNSSFPYDYEKTLVHELLHLKFSILDDSGNYIIDREVHRLIEDMARALIDAKRSKTE